MSLVVNKDSTRFLTTFLHHKLLVDSVWCDRRQVAYQRRRQFEHLGIALPGSYLMGDTISVIIQYHGNQYDCPFPRIENPLKFPHTLSVTTPGEYNYIFSGIIDSVDYSGGLKTFTVEQGEYLSPPGFVALATGWDTLTTRTAFGLPVHYIMRETQSRARISRKYSLLDEETRDDFISALDFMYGMLGHPPLVTDLYVRSGGRSVHSAAGFVKMPSSIGVPEESGGFSLIAGRAAAGQWFSALAQPVTYRGNWIMESVPEYLALMFVESTVGSSAYNRNLSYHRQTVLSVLDKRQDIPLACGIKGWSSKGVWTLHMLRNLMNSMDSTRDQSFKAWLQDVIHQANARPLTNEDLQDMAEKHFGYELQYFFDKWLYGTGIVEYDVTYSTARRDDGYYLNMDIVTSCVTNDYLAPILVRLETAKGPMYFDTFITPKIQKYQYGPFEEEPTEVLFNRYLSVLSRDKITVDR